MKAANYAPVYCALYPKLAELVRLHGYALAGQLVLLLVNVLLIYLLCLAYLVSSS